MDYFINYKATLQKDIQAQYEELQTQPVLFIGSGFSQRFIKTPTWEVLMKELERKCPLIEKSVDYYLQKEVSLPEIAEIYSVPYHEWAWQNKEKYPEHLFDSAYSTDIFIKYEVKKILTKLYEENKEQWSDDQKKEINHLKKIQPHAIVTTNYDPLLEHIFPEYQTAIGQDILRPDTLAIGEIFKIHGSTESPETIVLTQTDYEMFDKKMKYLSAKLLLFFIEHPIYFIGYGIRDTNILAILEDIREIIGFDKTVIPNLYFLEWDPKFENRTTFPREKTIGKENEEIILKHIVAESYEWIFKIMRNESVIDNIHPQHLRRFLARTYKLVKSDIPMRRVDVNFDILKGWEKHEDEISNVFSFIVTDDPSAALENYPYSLTDLAEKLGEKHWSAANKLIDMIIVEKGKNIKESNNKYHIQVGQSKRYSASAFDLLSKVSERDPYEVKL